MLENLNLDTLGHLSNGAARAIIDAAIIEAVCDLDDRGTDKKPRKVQIVLELCMLDNGQVAVGVDAQAVLPKRRTPATFAQIKREGVRTNLTFNALARLEPDQLTFEDYKEEE